MPLLRPQYREELRRAILDAARELFVRRGYESFSMRKLAEKLGCSHGNLYLYFKNKQQLFDCLVEDSFSQLSLALQNLQQRHYADDPVRLLKEAGRIYVNFGLSNPHAYEFAFVMRRSGPTRPYKPHPAFRFLRDTVKRCTKEKGLRAVDLDTIPQAIWAAVHGITSLLIARPNFPWAPKEDLISRVIDSAVDSVVSAVPKRQPRIVPLGSRRLRRRGVPT